MWKHCLLHPEETPSFIAGDSVYKFTDLGALRYEGRPYYCAEDRRATFALRIGYIGEHYYGFQLQRGQDINTVQSDLLKTLNRTSVAAGRTDKGVSALSQILSFHTFDAIEEDDIRDWFEQSSHQDSLRLLDCARVPRKFHALFSATWRRYVYLLPLLPGPYMGLDVDVEFIQRLFSRLLRCFRTPPKLDSYLDN